MRFFYNLKPVLINIIIVNLRPSSKFIDDDAVIYEFIFKKIDKRKLKGINFGNFFLFQSLAK